MYQTGHTIEKTLDQIHRHDLVLPAIQREFVWRPEQIGRLFDSLMQGYPFGTFLYWQVGAENSGKFKFYGFVLGLVDQLNRANSSHWSSPCPRVASVLCVRSRLQERSSRSSRLRKDVVDRIESRCRMGPASCRSEAPSSGVTSCLTWR